MKIEKTCLCVNNCMLPRTHDDDCDKFEFLSGREYQVDWMPSVEESLFKVYKNGGWDDYVIIAQERFDENFKMIE